MLEKKSRKNLTESIVTAMDGTDSDIFPFLPYILQDLWEIGSDPEIIIKAIEKHQHNFRQLKILDLGCGKGAVSVRIAQKLGCACFGIDGIPEFIDEANRKAREFQVEHLCRFTVGDIREQVRALSGFDIIILGSIGPVFGDFYTTLTTLKNCLSPQGVLIIDDGYIPDNSDFTHPLLQKRSEIYQQIQVAGMQLIDEFVSEEHNIRISDEYIYSLIEQRCAELSQIYPTKSYLFENYLSNQTKANDVLENEIVCSAMVIIPVAN